MEHASRVTGRRCLPLATLALLAGSPPLPRQLARLPAATCAGRGDRRHTHMTFVAMQPTGSPLAHYGLLSRDTTTTLDLDPPGWPCLNRPGLVSWGPSSVRLFPFYCLLFCITPRIPPRLSIERLRSLRLVDLGGGGGFLNYNYTAKVFGSLGRNRHHCLPPAFLFLLSLSGRMLGGHAHTHTGQLYTIMGFPRGPNGRIRIASRNSGGHDSKKRRTHHGRQQQTRVSLFAPLRVSRGGFSSY